MTTSKHMKFRVESPEHSRAIQAAVRISPAPYVEGKELFMNDSGAFFCGAIGGNSYQEHSLVKGQIAEGYHGKWDKFIPWFGGECPVKGIVSVVLRDGSVSNGWNANTWHWGNSTSDDGIIAYKVVEQSPEEGPEEPRLFDERIENLESAWSKKLTDMLMNCADAFGFASKAAQADKRAWEHLLVYAPLDVRFKTNGANRHPHADMIHEWAETGRKVQSYDDEEGAWKTERCPRWEESHKFRWRDEQPDVIKFMTVHPCTMYPSKDPNCKFTFDADGKLKDVEVIKQLTATRFRPYADVIDLQGRYAKGEEMKLPEDMPIL